MDTALVLSTVYNRMIESWREKKPTNDNSQMNLIRNSTHEFESPLNLLIHSLEMVSEDTLDERTRDILKHAYEASNAIVNKVERLLSLTDIEANAKNGSNDLSGETFDLKSSATRALQTLHKEARRNGFQFTISVHDQLPAYVRGNGDQFRSLLDHLIQSVFKLGSSAVQCNVFLSRNEVQNSTLLIQVKDSGPGLSRSQLKVMTVFPLVVQPTNTLYRSSLKPSKTVKMRKNIRMRINRPKKTPAWQSQPSVNTSKNAMERFKSRMSQQGLSSV